jgi:pyruvate/2-oxoglutarate dehydrogenase complex dihydrolipoamide acyltransferase (E2) component
MARVSVVAAAFGGTVLKLAVAPGEPVRDGADLMVIESMKMEHVIEAPATGVVESFSVSVGDTVQQGEALLLFAPSVSGDDPVATGLVTVDTPIGEPVRPELADLRRRTAATLDAGRPEATERRHAKGRRTARENIEDLCDPGSFEEYGRFVIAAQRARRSRDDLIANTPTDGLIAGLARVNGDLFPPEQARCAVLSYDYSVLAGTQGQMNHKKKDRLFDLIERLHLPVVLFAEGGGGRPGDTDTASVTGLDTAAFALFGALSGRCHSSVSSRAAASPATRPCSGAATSSSPRPTPTSGWAGRP